MLKLQSKLKQIEKTSKIFLKDIPPQFFNKNMPFQNYIRITKMKGLNLNLLNQLLN